MDEEKRRVLDENNVPKPLESWIGKAKKGMRSNMLQVLDAVVRADPEGRSVHDGIAEVSGVPKGTIGTVAVGTTRLCDLMESVAATRGRLRRSVTGRWTLTGQNSIGLSAEISLALEICVRHIDTPTIAFGESHTVSISAVSRFAARTAYSLLLNHRAPDPIPDCQMTPWCSLCFCGVTGDT